MTKQEIMEKRIGQLETSLKREKAIRKEVENDKATLTHLENLEHQGQNLEESSNYSSYGEWKEAIQKQIKRGETSLENIGIKKIELEAFRFYLDSLKAEA